MTQLFNSAKDNARPQNSFKDKNLKQESLLCFQFIFALFSIYTNTKFNFPYNIIIQNINFKNLFKVLDKFYFKKLTL